jgi:hypothetical protein
MKIKTLTLFAPLCGMLVSSLCSQEMVNVRISALSLDGRVTDVKYEHAGESHDMHIFARQRSMPFEYSGPETFTLFRETGQLDAAGNPLRQVVAETKIPRSSGQYLLILSKKSDSPERYRVLPIADDWKSFKAGSYRFLNLAPFQIVIKIDDDVFRIKERGMTDIDADLEHNKHHQTMMVSIPEGGEPIPIFEGLLRHQKDKRTLYVVTPRGDVANGKVRMVGISDLVPLDVLQAGQSAAR